MVYVVGMSDKHRNVLKSKRSDLLRSIDVSVLFLAELTSNYIITRPMRLEIEVNNCMASRFRIPKRGWAVDTARRQSTLPVVSGHSVGAHQPSRKESQQMLVLFYSHQGSNKNAQLPPLTWLNCWSGQTNLIKWILSLCVPGCQLKMKYLIFQCLSLSYCTFWIFLLVYLEKFCQSRQVDRRAMA